MTPRIITRNPGAEIAEPPFARTQPDWRARIVIGIVGLLFWTAVACMVLA